ncbi:sugar ABC transporter substrate-binding protein [Paraburkholderia caballeronis]|uniref:sugar ABC transporter substrate-binding protein n=1 Tax=Paraburkholderia caballeronis TaxID=416943 RepID=UPI0010649D25|nr:sugar ABC transporter substrate-binding protein [Paraburkholderia caballeronis]TDV09216.1 ribose transport system substrate-binding protein [Paraburkholderia caballeronis]TDV12276.1 ribose transport system substrate-binding protein [Paraburkholderia caballeronis]TDV22749.1 ribose transport system substrate-binding protein [Paraburkholderia caballeronis]
MALSSAGFDGWSRVGASAATLVLCAAAVLSGCSKSESPSSGASASGASAASAPEAAASAPAATAAAAPASPAAPAGGKLKVGFSIATLNNAFFVGLKSGVERGAKEQGFDLVQTNANGDAQQQVNDAMNLLSQGVNALVLNPIDSKAIIPAVQKANQMNVAVFMLDRGSDGGTVTSFVASDNVALGRAGAQWIAVQLKQRYGSEKGDVVDLIGLVGTTAATDREKGFSEEIAKYPDIKVVARQEGGFDQEKSLNAMTNILQKYPQIDAVFGANDDNTVGAEKAIDNAGRYHPPGDNAHILVIGADGTAQALSAIRAGKQDATISQNPIGMAAKAMSFITDHAANKDVPANYAWPTHLIDKSNIDSDETKQYGLWSLEVSQ